MSFQTLPDDILIGILQYVSSWITNSRINFKQQLQLLAVFQQLRALAMPKVYNHVYIRFSAYSYYKRPSYINKFCKSFADCIDTNVDIIALASCTRMVTSAKIGIDGLSTTHDELHKIIEALQSCANVWPKITKLEMFMDNKSYPKNLSESVWIQHCRLDKKYSQELANIIPSVTEVSLLSACYSDANNFYNQVVDVYADQLVRLTNMNEFDHIDRQKLKVLQYLQLSMNNHMKLPRVNCHTLVDLNIRRISANASWAPFLDNKDDTVVEFTRLERLRLSFIYDEAAEHIDENVPELLLKFPVLSSLTITFYAEVCPFFKMAVLPNDLKVISEKTQQVTLAHIYTPRMPLGKEIIMRRA